MPILLQKLMGRWQGPERNIASLAQTVSLYMGFYVVFGAYSALGGSAASLVAGRIGSALAGLIVFSILFPLGKGVSRGEPVATFLASLIVPSTLLLDGFLWHFSSGALTSLAVICVTLMISGFYSFSKSNA